MIWVLKNKRSQTRECYKKDYSFAWFYILNSLYSFLYYIIFVQVYSSGVERKSPKLRAASSNLARPVFLLLFFSLLKELFLFCGVFFDIFGLVYKIYYITISNDSILFSPTVSSIYYISWSFSIGRIFKNFIKIFVIS